MEKRKWWIALFTVVLLCACSSTETQTHNDEVKKEDAQVEQTKYKKRCYKYTREQMDQIRREHPDFVFRNLKIICTE